jgi:Ion channel
VTQDGGPAARAQLARYRFGAVFLLTLGLAIFILLVNDGRVARAAEVLLAGLTLIVSVFTGAAPWATRRAASVTLTIALIAGVAVSLIARVPAAVSLGICAVVSAATVATMAGGVVRAIFAHGVNVRVVLGALSIYLLVGIFFGFLIGTLAGAVHGSYFAQGTDGDQSQRLYFSFTTLTTTGYGDLTPALRGGRALSVLEMLIGQLYLITVISLLVGNLRQRRTDP